MTSELKPCESSPDCYHLTCKGCDRLLRIGRDLAKDHLGTVAGGEKSRKCVGCARREKSPLKYQKRPDHCLGCKKPMRSETQSPDDYPGTVVHGAKGRCRTCYWRKKHLRRCVDCNRQMRPERAPAEEFPGTVKFMAKGRCTGCYSRTRYRPEVRGRYMSGPKLNARQAKLKAFGTEAPLDFHFWPLGDDILDRMSEVDGGLRKYIERRRRRGVPTEGRQYYMSENERIQR